MVQSERDVAGAAASPPPSGWQIGGLWRRLRLAFYALVVLSVLLVLFEAAHLVQVGAAVHPLLGVVVGLAIVAAAVGLGIPLWRMLWIPRVVTPPAVPSDGLFEPRHVVEQCRYLDRYLRNCRKNEALAEQWAAVDVALAELAVARPRWEVDDPAALGGVRGEIKQWVERRVSPLLAPLDAKAERLIYQEALSVGLGTAISPYGTLDAFVVLWRSVQMTGKLATLYYGRPGPIGALRVLIDVALAAAAASYMQSIGNSLGSLVARSLGGIAGVVAGPATQGITNSLVMVRLGYLVQRRCRSFRQWDPNEQRSALAAALSATQKVAVGLVTEILRQAGSGLGVVAGAAAKGVSQAAGGVASAAEAALGFARDVGQRIANGLRSLGETEASASRGGDAAS